MEEKQVKIRGGLHMSDKRNDYITWDEYFMGVAKLSAMRSKDPSTQVGACIVSDDNKILSMGYNGFPNSHGERNTSRMTPTMRNIFTPPTASSMQS